MKDSSKHIKHKKLRYYCRTTSWWYREQVSSLIISNEIDFEKLESLPVRPSASLRAIVPSRRGASRSSRNVRDAANRERDIRRCEFDVGLSAYKTGRARVFGLSAVGYKYESKSNDMHSRHMKYSSGPATWYSQMHGIFLCIFVYRWHG